MCLSVEQVGYSPSLPTGVSSEVEFPPRTEAPRRARPRVEFSCSPRAASDPRARWRCDARPGASARTLERGGDCPAAWEVSAGTLERGGDCSAAWEVSAGTLELGGDCSAAWEVSDESYSSVGPWAECVLGLLKPGEDLDVQA